MRNLLKKFPGPFFIIIALFTVIVVTGILLYYSELINIKPAELTILSISFTATSILILIIFLKGKEKEGKEGAMYSMVAISLKLLIEMVIALIWFITFKKTGMEYILLFFVLYLSFSLCSILSILNILNKKTL